MSVLQTETLGNLAGTRMGSVERIVRGHAKMWANLNGSGTIALRNSLNVSSTVDLGAGNYGFNYISAFAAADYQAVYAAFSAQTFANSITTVAMAGLTRDTTGAPLDSSMVWPDAKGDLA